MDLPAPSPDSAEMLLRLCRSAPLILLKSRALNVYTASLRHRNAEGTLQSVHKFASNDPLKRFRESAHVHQTRWFCLMEVESKKEVEV